MPAKNFATQRWRQSLVEWEQTAASPLVTPLGDPVGSIDFDGSAVNRPIDLKTGGGSTSSGWTRQNVVQMQVFPITKFGAVGDGAFDNTAAINAAIAAADAAGGGIIYVPTGNFACLRPSPVNFASIVMTSSHDLLFLGNGASSKISQIGDMGGTGSFLFWIQDQCRRLTFRFLCFSGQAITNPDPGEQNHLFVINGRASNTSGPQDIEISDCFFDGIVGDSIRLLGEPSKNVINTRILTNVMECTHGRSCIQIQRGSRRVMIHYNWLTGPDDQDIDFEPTAATESQDSFSIVGNQTRNLSTSLLSISLGGDSQFVPQKQSLFAHNIVYGYIFPIALRDTTMVGNVVWRDQDGDGSPVLFFQRSNNGISILGCVLRNKTVGSVFDSYAISIAGQAGFMLPSRFLVSDCVSETSRGELGHSFQSAYYITITGCIAILNPINVGTAVAYAFRSIDGIDNGWHVVGCIGGTNNANRLLDLVRFSNSPSPSLNQMAFGNLGITMTGLVRWERTTEPFFGVRTAVGNLGVVTNNGIEPPGANAGAVIATNLPPYSLTAGQTLTVSINGAAAATTTFTATAGVRTGVAGTYPTGFTGGQTLILSIDGAANTTITFQAADQLLVDVIARINGVIGAVALASNSGGQLRITSLKLGTASSVNIVGGTGRATLGMAIGVTSGTGNVADITQVSAAEVAAAVKAATAGSNSYGGIAGTVTDDGLGIPPVLWTSTLGSGGSIQVTGGTANPTINFPTGLVQGGTLATTVNGGGATQGPQIMLSLTPAAGPNGETPGAVGALFLSPSGAADAVVWNKQSGGTGRTGWASIGGYTLQWGCQSTDATTTAARFMAPSADLATAGTAEIQVVMSRPCTIRNLRIQCTAGTGGGTVTYTVRKNAANTTLAATINNTASTGSQTANPQTFAQGDRLSISITKSALPTTAQTGVTVTVEMI
jgi:pectate lyase-like protein